MNYWPAEVCNLAECHEPLFDLIDSLPAQRPQDGEGASTTPTAGRCTRSRTSSASPRRASRRAGPVPRRGAWLCQHLWEHYAFSGDRQFLERAWPIMQESAEFYLDLLVEDPQDRQARQRAGELAREHVHHSRRPARLAVHGAGDGSADHLGSVHERPGGRRSPGHRGRLRRSASAAPRERLLGPQIGSDGRLLEWSQEFKEAEPGHRHVSHLFALHPGRQISVTEHAGTGRRGQEVPGVPARPRRRPHRLEPGLDHQLLGPSARCARRPTRTSSRCWPSRLFRTSSTPTRPSRSTATSAAPPASRRCSCKATRARSTCCPPCRAHGPAAPSKACGPAAASRWTSPGRTANSPRRPSGATKDRPCTVRYGDKTVQINTTKGRAVRLNAAAHPS